MKPHLIFSLAFVLTMTLGVLPDHGTSIEHPVTPKNLTQGPFVFSVSSKPVKEGTAFHIVITAKNGDISSDSNASLSLVRHSQDGSESIGPRKEEPPLTLQKSPRHWEADFVATSGLLKNPDACFVFEVLAHAIINGKSVPMPSMDVYKITLSDFPTP